MRPVQRAFAVAGFAVLLVATAGAQHEERQTGAAGATAGAAMGGMMSPQMMSHMMAGHDEASKLVDELMKNVTALQAEKKLSAGTRQKLAEQAALLKQLQAKQAEHMGMMSGMAPGAPEMKGCCEKK